MAGRKVFTIFKKNMFLGKTAVVTGGGTGIGRAISEELLELGCTVVIASRQEDRLQKAVEEIQTNFLSNSSEVNISAVQCNIRKENEVKRLIEITLEKHGRLDYLVNNGGGQFLSPLADISRKGWDAVIETNLTGAFQVSKEAYNQWMKKNGGSIVNIVMETARGSPLMSHSGAARAALVNLTKSLSVEWAQDGIRVNAVAPGITYSETAEKNYPGDAFSQVKPFIPAKRFALPMEISSVVCFLLSPGASFVSGETINVSSAMHHYAQSYWIIPEHDKLKPFDGLLEDKSSEKK